MIPLPAVPPAMLARIAAGAAVIIAAFATGYVHGLRSEAERHNEYVAAQAQQAVRIAAKQAATDQRVVTRYVKVKADAQAVTQTIEKEVIRYVETNPGACLDRQWQRVHDAAALDVIPDPPSVADGTAGAPSAATALETVTENYAACNRNADRLEALQAWVKAQIEAGQE